MCVWCILRMQISVDTNFSGFSERRKALKLVPAIFVQVNKLYT